MSKQNIGEYNMKNTTPFQHLTKTMKNTIAKAKLNGIKFNCIYRCFFYDGRLREINDEYADFCFKFHGKVKLSLKEIHDLIKIFEYALKSIKKEKKKNVIEAERDGLLSLDEISKIFKKEVYFVKHSTYVDICMYNNLPVRCRRVATMPIRDFYSVNEVKDLIYPPEWENAQ